MDLAIRSQEAQPPITDEDFNMLDDVIYADGHNGQLELTRSSLLIKRGGAIAFLTQGLKGTKEISIDQITAVQFKDASSLLNGYIQFTITGGVEQTRGIFSAPSDENSVVFRSSQQKAFAALRDTLRERISNRKSANVVSPRLGLDDLEKLAALREKGILSETEFQAKKKQILGM